MNYVYTLAANHPRDLLARLEAEQAHVARLAVSSQMWSRAATVIEETRKRLFDRTEAVVRDAWHDAGGAAFRTAVVESVTTMMKWHGLITSYGFPGGSVSSKIDDLVGQYPRNVERVRLICEQYETAKAQDDTTPVDQYLAQAATVLGDHDRGCQAVTAIMRNLVTFAVDWSGPRAAAAERSAPGVTQPGTPGSSTGSGGSPGDPAEAGNPDTAPDPESPQEPQNVPSGEQPDLSDALNAATSALQAAEGLLGGNGMQVPDPVSVPDVHGLDHAPQSLPHGGALPTLAGLDAGGAGGGGLGGAAGSVTGVGTTGPGNPVGTGTAPVPTAVARGVAGTAAAAGAMGSSPPMMPPGTGAAAGPRQPGGGIKPGNSDRPAAQPRPRARRAGPVTPGVALTGRAGAGTPTPTARRGWDSDNDSLQVLDEHLWQVHPQEEETHGQDRRGHGRDGGDRTTAHPAPTAGLAGPGRRADQPPGAR